MISAKENYIIIVTMIGVCLYIESIEYQHKLPQYYNFAGLAVKYS